MAGFSYEVEIPGRGKFRIDSPSELSDAQAYQAASQNVGPDPTEGMSTTDKVRAGFGQGFANIGRGARDFASDTTKAHPFAVPEALRLLHKLAPIKDEEVAEAKALDAPLLNTGAGAAGSFAGNVATALPAAFVPGANTVAGAGVVGGLMGLLQPTAEGESRTANIAIGTGGGVLAQGLFNKIGNAVATRFANKTNQLATQKGANAVRDATIAEARKAGYVFPPTSVNSGPVNSILEAVSGKIKTGQAASFKNQEVTNGLIRKALGLADDAPLTGATLAQVRSDAAAAGYAPVRSLQSVNWDAPFEDAVKSLIPKGGGAIENPANAEVSVLANKLLKKGAWSGDQLVDDIILLREMGRSNVNGAKAAGGDLTKSTLGKAQLKAASLLEDLAERNLKNNRAPADTIQALRDARQLIAKTFDVEKALDGAGNVSAASIANILKKGKPLTGEMATVGRTGAAFPKATQTTPQIGSANPLSAVDAMVGTGAAIGTGSPAGLLAPLARPGARSILLSRPYQNAMVNPPSYTPGGFLTLSNNLLPVFRRGAGVTGAAGLLGYTGQ